jgi:2,5-dichloro-2,5-cyclohexadiene-1,4-diol dehydrogenase 1
MNDAYAKLDMTGKVVAITGGASGFGAETGALLTARGASVVLADINGAGAQAVADKINASGNGHRAVAIQCDVAREADCKAVVDLAVSTFGGLHGAFNNAGVDTGHFSAVDQPLEAWQRSFAVNVTGIMLGIKYQAAHMLAHGGGAIVNTASTAAVAGFPEAVAYCSSKHAVIGLTRAAAMDFATKGIRVNAILPGSAETGIYFEAAKDPAMAEYMNRTHPMGRVGKPFEIAEMVAWLLSDAATFATGGLFSIDGGFTVP